MSPRPDSELTILTRRDALRLGLGGLLTLGLWPGCRHAPERDFGSFSFIAVNDTHYMTEACGQFLNSVVAQMKTHPEVDFCLHAGDLVEKGERSHLAAVREIFAGLGCPIHTQIGNHDYLTHSDRGAYDELFPRKANYVFRHEGWQFVGLDTSDGLRYENTRIQPATLRWVDDNIAQLDKERPTVIFTHFPLGTGVTYRPLNADELLQRFTEHNLRGVFSGHFHGFTERVLGQGVATTNRCCALKRHNHDKSLEKGYFLCRATGDGTLERRFVQVTMPSATQAQP